MALATAMFRHAWDVRRVQAKDIKTAAKLEVGRIDQEIEAIPDRIMEASNAVIIRRYEDKVENLERQKALMAEKQAF